MTEAVKGFGVPTASYASPRDGIAGDSGRLEVLNEEGGKSFQTADGKALQLGAKIKRGSRVELAKVRGEGFDKGNGNFGAGFPLSEVPYPKRASGAVDLSPQGGGAVRETLTCANSQESGRYPLGLVGGSEVVNELAHFG